MISDLDLYATAKLLIDQHDDDAPVFAAQQAVPRQALWEVGQGRWSEEVGLPMEVRRRHSADAVGGST